MYIQCFTVDDFQHYPRVFLTFMFSDSFSGLHVVMGDKDEKHSILTGVLQCFDIQPYHKGKPRLHNGTPTLFTENKRRGKKARASIRRTCRKKGIPCFHPIFYSINYHNRHVVPWLAQLGASCEEAQKHAEPSSKEVSDTILKLLNDDFLPAPWQAAMFDSRGLLVRDSAGFIMPLKDVREDFITALRIVLAILCNIFRLCAPTQAVAEVAGAILIANFDQTLSPEWQVKLMRWLLAHFPKVQFIIDSRNPEVIQVAQDVFVLEIADKQQNTSFRRLAPSELL